MEKYRVSGFIIIGLVLVSIFFSLYYRQNDITRIHQHVHYQTKTVDLSKCDHDEKEFCTHLPIIIIDIEEKEFPIQVETIKKEEMIKGYFSIIDHENQLNHFHDQEIVHSPMEIRIRGNSSIYYDKKQYLIKLMDEKGEENKLSLLGMAEDEEWILNGSYVDKSLMRNYLALNIAGEIMDYSPRVRFCEVFLREGSDNKYIGVYLLVESIKRGEEKIDINNYDPTENFTSYIVRRDRYSVDENILNNYGTVNELTKEYIGVKYPSKKNIDMNALRYIENDISIFEERLYSNETKSIYWYEQYIDVDSFIDYFIINEFFGNYDAGLHSTYAYKDTRGKLTMGPVWDFDQAIDNYSEQILRTDAMALQDYSWFDALVKDPIFTEKLINRYYQLRKGVLSQRYIEQYIDQTVLFLGDAVERNNKVWGGFYEENYLDEIELSDGTIINRNTQTYTEEIDRIKEVQQAKGLWMDEHIDKLCFCNVDNTKPINPNDYSALLFISFFLLVIVLVRRS